jgi:hypothetical protein
VTNANQIQAPKAAEKSSYEYGEEEEYESELAESQGKKPSAPAPAKKKADESLAPDYFDDAESYEEGEESEAEESVKPVPKKAEPTKEQKAVKVENKPVEPPSQKQQRRDYDPRKDNILHISPENSRFEQSLEDFKPNQEEGETSLPSNTRQRQFQYMGGVKPEHILSDDSILQAFVKNDLKKAVEFAEPSSSQKRSDLPSSSQKRSDLISLSEESEQKPTKP